MSAELGTMLLFAAGLLIVIAATFMALWLIDARRADHIATDRERLPRRQRRRSSYAPRH